MSWFVRAALSAGALFLLFSFVPLESVGAALGNIGVAWFSLALLVYVTEIVAMAVRIRILTGQSSMPLSTGAILEINLVASFYALFVPGDLAAGAIRWYRMSRPSGQRAEAFAAISFARLIDTIGLFALGGLAFLLDGTPLGGPILLVLVGGL
ncbi:MAG: lysylphosphatidylglycerol synthase domain-containing protein, partial [Geminicoccaceae bacterium]|nr:lysylphosphatidylglycerol synthase domain-containing protein [Geminicoccaceae bacterium]